MNKAKLSVYNEMEVSFKQMANCFTVSPASSSWCPSHPDFSYIFWSLHLFIFLIYSSAKIYIIAWMFGNISPAFHCNTSSNLLTVFFCKIRYGIWSKKLLPWQTQIPLLPNKGFPFFFMVIMNQEALREGNNIERLMMMNRFGKTPADLKLPSPLPLQALPVLLMQNKMKKLLQKEAENSPRKIWNNETETEDVRTHSSEWEENTQVDFKAGNDLQTARKNISSSWGTDLAWKSSACHKVPLLPLQDPLQRIPAKVMKQDGDMRAQPSSLEYQSCYLQKEKWEFKKQKQNKTTWCTFSFWSWNIPAQFSI